MSSYLESDCAAYNIRYKCTTHSRNMLTIYILRLIKFKQLRK